MKPFTEVISAVKHNFIVDQDTSVDRSYAIGLHCDLDTLLDIIEVPDPNSDIIPSEVIRGLWHSNKALNDRLQCFNALLSLDCLRTTRSQLQEYEESLRQQASIHGANGIQRAFLVYIQMKMGH